MRRTMLKSKLHRGKVTQADLSYEGSISIDKTLMDRADLLQYEKVDIYNLTNGNRLSTYVIEAPAGSGEICVNGAAAHLVQQGHEIIITSFIEMNEGDLWDFEPKVILLDEKNRPKAKARNLNMVERQLGARFDS